MIYDKINLKVSYPPPYNREVWNYQVSNDDLITPSINEFDWNRTFINKNVNEKVFIFKKLF